MISAKFVPLKYYTLSSQLQCLASFSVGCSGRRSLSPGQINIMRKWCIKAVSVKSDGGPVCYCYDYYVDAQLQNWVVCCILHLIGSVMSDACHTRLFEPML